MAFGSIVDVAGAQTGQDVGDRRASTKLENGHIRGLDPSVRRRAPRTIEQAGFAEVRILMSSEGDDAVSHAGAITDTSTSRATAPR